MLIRMVTIEYLDNYITTYIFGHGFGSLVEFLLIKKFEVKEGHPKGGVMLLRVELLSMKGVNRKERDSDTRIDH